MRTSRKDRRRSRLRREVLLPGAVAFDLYYEEEVANLAPDGPREIAFRLVCLGYDTLLQILPEGFPSDSARARRLGAKLVRKKLLFTGLDASKVIAHATMLLLTKTGGDLWGEISGETLPGPAHHQGLYDRVADFYPIKLRRAKNVVRRALAEFEVMETHELRDEVVEGTHPASPYAKALLAGENPDENPELVEAQKLYARDYFINQILVGMVRVALQAHRPSPPSTYPLVEDKVLDINLINDLNDPRLPELYRRSLSAWIAGSRVYREYAIQEVERVPL